MEAEGLLVGRDDVQAGRRVRRYLITNAGRQALTEGRRVLKELAAEVLGDR